MLENAAPSLSGLRWAQGCGSQCGTPGPHHKSTGDPFSHDVLLKPHRSHIGPRASCGPLGVWTRWDKLETVSARARPCAMRPLQGGSWQVTSCARCPPSPNSCRLLLEETKKAAWRKHLAITCVGRAGVWRERTQYAEGRGGFGQEAAFPDSSGYLPEGTRPLQARHPTHAPCFMPAVTLQGGFIKPGGRQGRESGPQSGRNRQSQAPAQI